MSTQNLGTTQPEPMTAEEWAEWLDCARDEELESAVRDSRDASAATDAEKELQRRERCRAECALDDEREDLYCGKPYPHFDCIGPDGEAK